MAEGSHGEGYSLHVGDLDYEVSSDLLVTTFRTYYPSCRTAMVMTEPGTNRSRGFGFVRFNNEQERDRAISEMTGVFIGSKQIKCSPATQRKPVVPGQGMTHTGTTHSTPGSTGQSGENTNTTLFIGGLSSSISETELHATFVRCGEIVYTKVIPGKGCGFVQYRERSAAEYALESMNGMVLGGMSLRIEWGKSSKPAPAQGSYHAASSHAPLALAYGAHAAYTAYAGAAYDPYGYAAGYAYDPYAGAYAGYGVDPYAAYAGYGAVPAAGGPAAAAAAAQAAAQAAGAGAGTQPVLYDPLAPVDVNKMNSAYMHRHIPVFTGAYIRVPVASLPMAAHM